MKVVVTGVSGFLGRHVAGALTEAGHAVRGVDRVAPDDTVDSFVCADVTDLGEALLAIESAEAVVHAAAIPRPVGYTAREVFAVNVTAAYNVVEAAVRLGVRRLASASSFSVLGFPFNPRPLAPQYLPVDEAHPCLPQEAYGLSKLITEEILAAAARRTGLGAVSLRMPWIQVPASFASEVVGRRLDPAVGAANLWSYIDARDAAHAFVRAVERDAPGHLALYVSASDTFMEQTTAELVAATFPEAEVRTPLGGHRSVLDTTAVEAELGFRARHSWRDYPAGGTAA